MIWKGRNSGQRRTMLAAVADGQVYDLTATGEVAFASLNAWLSSISQHGLAQAVLHLRDVAAELKAVYHWADLQHPPDSRQAHLLPPLDTQEVWAAGVTYLRSREAREEESRQIGIYDNDVSSRDGKGENPLYLPQAKIYSRSCALGPVITLASDLSGTALIELTL